MQEALAGVVAAEAENSRLRSQLVAMFTGQGLGASSPAGPAPGVITSPTTDRPVQRPRPRPPPERPERAGQAACEPPVQAQLAALADELESTRRQRDVHMQRLHKVQESLAAANASLAERDCRLRELEQAAQRADEERQRQVAALERQLGEARQQVQSCDDEAAALRKQVRTLQSQLDKASQEQRSVNAQLDAALAAQSKAAAAHAAQLRELQDANADLQRRLNEAAAAHKSQQAEATAAVHQQLAALRVEVGRYKAQLQEEQDAKAALERTVTELRAQLAGRNQNLATAADLRAQLKKERDTITAVREALMHPALEPLDRGATLPSLVNNIHTLLNRYGAAVERMRNATWLTHIRVRL